MSRAADIAAAALLGRALLAACALCPGVASAAQILGGPEMPPVEWEQRLGAQVPLDAHFVDHEGRDVRLDELLGERPVVLALVYYECPMLCNLVLEGLVSALRDVSFDAGQDYRVVVVSIDPHESHELAAAKRQAYLQAYDRPGSEGDWSFLVGEEAEIRRLAESIGFRYTYVEETGEYAHGAGVTVLTAGGVVSSVLFGASFEPRDLRLALVEAGQGRVGSPIDQILLRCFHYDPSKGKYGLAILGGLRLAGTLTVLLIGGAIARQLLRERRSTSPGGPAQKSCSKT